MQLTAERAGRFQCVLYVRIQNGAIADHVFGSHVVMAVFGPYNYNNASIQAASSITVGASYDSSSGLVCTCACFRCVGTIFAALKTDPFPRAFAQRRGWICRVPDIWQCFFLFSSSSCFSFRAGDLSCCSSSLLRIGS